MKRLAVFVLLCSCAAACNREDTASDGKWPRRVQARFRDAQWSPCVTVPLAPDRVVKTAQCGPPPSDGPCDATIETRDDAVKALLSNVRCTDPAIARLEGLARTNSDVLSDLAAAYYVRAQRDDFASDLLRAFDAADRAVATQPDDMAALFNLALVQEAIGLSEEAIASWDAVVQSGENGWADEARDHRAQMAKHLADDGSSEWKRNREALSAALRRGDGAAVEKLIARYPRSALAFFEQEILPAGNEEAITLLAEKLAARLEDRFVVDVARASKNDRKRLLRLVSEREQAGVIASSDPKRAIAMLDPVEGEVRTRGYPYLTAQALSMRGFIHLHDSSYIESLADYEAARKTYAAIGDIDMLASTDRSIAGLYRDLGQYERSWRIALQCQSNVPRIVNSRYKTTVAGETAKTARQMGYPQLALVRQESEIRRIQRALAALPPQEIDDIKKLRHELASMRRTSVEIALELEDYERATRELAETKRLMDEDSTELRDLQAYLLNVEGRVLLKVNPAAAAVSFTRALSLVDPERLRSFRVSLLVQAAEASRRAGREEQARRQMIQAFQELAEEEKQILAKRKRGEREDVWSGYFARFADPYRQLIRQYVDRPWTAFEYAERSRAIEPLDLVRDLDSTPRHFLDLTKDGQPIALATLQKELAPGTFLLQYCVTDDQTYTWIISRDDRDFVAQNVSRRDIERWSNALRTAGSQHEFGIFESNLVAPFRQLLAEPLKRIERMNHGRAPERLVLIPDGAMHGLPFAALRDDVTHRHLVEIAPIEIAGSATLYVFSTMRNEALRSVPESVLLVGDPDFNRARSLANDLDALPAARAEVLEIATFYAPHAETLIGAEATVPQFLRLAQNRTLVHFAGHSIVSEREPSQSFLLLADSAGRTGALEARELITALKLDQTRLVVLAACSTAGGHPVGPEGVAPLVRPLIGAGVPAVIGSLWNVDDATAKVLFVSFHQDYRTSGDAAAALRNAQLRLLKHDNRLLQSPLAWAPYQVIGH